MSDLEEMAEMALSTCVTKTIQLAKGPSISVTTFGDQKTADVSANNGEKYRTDGASELVSTIEEVLSACQNLDEFDFEFSDNDVEWLLSLFED
ncbi:hypothetical protein ACUZ9P_00275 [Desulfovibrio sp. QI0430]